MYVCAMQRRRRTRKKPITARKTWTGCAWACAVVAFSYVEFLDERRQGIEWLEAGYFTADHTNERRCLGNPRLCHHHRQITLVSTTTPSLRSVKALLISLSRVAAENAGKSTNCIDILARWACDLSRSTYN